MRKFLAICAGKLVRLLLRLLGRNASSFPGTVALKLCPDLLSRMTLPPLTVAVTGSNGKTSTTELINNAAALTGKKVISNSYGSNQIEGVTAMMILHSTLTGRVKADIAVIESDERFCQYTFSHFTPDYIVITNLFRDQLTRNGHSEFVRKELKKGLPEGSTLIINADEPVSASLGDGRDKLLRFGVAANAFSDRYEYHAYHDGAYCPLCYAKMEYDYFIDHHIGGYRCPECGFARGKVDHEITAVEEDSFIIDGKYKVKPQIPNTMFAYNIAAAFTVATEAFGLDPAAVAENLNGHLLQNGRIRNFDINGHKGTFLLSKHENSMGYNGGLQTAASCDDPDGVTLVVIIDRLSRKYAAHDTSWIWDVDFECAASDNIRRVIVGGGFAHDLAVRMLCAGVSEDKLTVKPDLDEMMESLYEDPIGSIYVLTCFTDVDKFIDRLKGEKIS